MDVVCSKTFDKEQTIQPDNPTNHMVTSIYHFQTSFVGRIKLCMQTKPKCQGNTILTIFYHNTKEAYD